MIYNNEKYILSIVLGTFNRLQNLSNLVQQLLEKGIDSKEIIIIDGGSTDGTIEYLCKLVKENANITTILDYNRLPNKQMKRSLQECYNMGFKISRGRYIVHLNDDCEIDMTQKDKWPQKAIEFMETPGNELVGLLCLMLGEREKTGSEIKYRFSYDDIVGTQLMFANHGIIHRGFFEKLGWWDEGYEFYAADNDFAMKVRDAGMHVIGFKETDKIIHLSTKDQTREINETYSTNDFTRLRAKWMTKASNMAKEEMKKLEVFRGINIVRNKMIPEVNRVTITPE